MKKFFMSLLTIFLLALSTVSAAEEIDSETLLNDMRNNPKNYIYVGHISNVGDFIYVIKSSVDVKEYNPPKYIIEIKCAQFWAKGGRPSRTKDSANLLWKGTPFRFMYDYDSKKIYISRTDKDDKVIWQQFEKKDANGGLISFNSMAFAAAELAFYFAYDKYFYGEPISYQLKKYAEEGKGTFADRL